LESSIIPDASSSSCTIAIGAIDFIGATAAASNLDCAASIPIGSFLVNGRRAKAWQETGKSDYTVTREVIMALTSAEKQQRYRERHLGIHDTKERIQFAFRQGQRARASRPLPLRFVTPLTPGYVLLRYLMPRAFLTLIVARQARGPSVEDCGYDETFRRGRDLLLLGLFEGLALRRAA
jgi:hypothetical protein